MAVPRNARRFPLAPMSRPIRVLTAVLLMLPAVFVSGGLLTGGGRVLVTAGLLVAVLYVVVWLFWRPTAFDVSPAELRIVWPLRSASIDRSDIAGVRGVDAKSFRAEFGLPLRIGVGGLWGGFGWLWTTRRGLLEFYVSRTTGLVLVERRTGRTLLLTPADAEGFVRALSPAG
jgi:hypothetical protein